MRRDVRGGVPRLRWRLPFELGSGVRRRRQGSLHSDGRARRVRLARGKRHVGDRLARAAVRERGACDGRRCKGLEAGLRLQHGGSVRREPHRRCLARRRERLRRPGLYDDAGQLDVQRKPARDRLASNGLRAACVGAGGRRDVRGLLLRGGRHDGSRRIEHRRVRRERAEGRLSPRHDGGGPGPRDGRRGADGEQPLRRVACRKRRVGDDGGRSHHVRVRRRQHEHGRAGRCRWPPRPAAGCGFAGFGRGLGGDERHGLQRCRSERRRWSRRAGRCGGRPRHRARNPHCVRLGTGDRRRRVQRQAGTRWRGRRRPRRKWRRRRRSVRRVRRRRRHPGRRRRLEHRPSVVRVRRLAGELHPHRAESRRRRTRRQRGGRTGGKRHRGQRSVRRMSGRGRRLGRRRQRWARGAWWALAGDWLLGTRAERRQLDDDDRRLYRRRRTWRSGRSRRRGRNFAASGRGRGRRAKTASPRRRRRSDGEPLPFRPNRCDSRDVLARGTPLADEQSSAGFSRSASI